MITEDTKLEIKELLEVRLAITDEVTHTEKIKGLSSSYEVHVNHKSYTVDLSSSWIQEITC